MTALLKNWRPRSKPLKRPFLLLNKFLKSHSIESSHSFEVKYYPSFLWLMPHYGSRPFEPTFPLHQISNINIRGRHWILSSGLIGMGLSDQYGGIARRGRHDATCQTSMISQFLLQWPFSNAFGYDREAKSTYQCILFVIPLFNICTELQQ